MRLIRADGYPAQGAPFTTVPFLKALHRDPMHRLEHLVIRVLLDHLSPNLFAILRLRSRVVQVDTPKAK